VSEIGLLRILITGATGFLGRRICERIIQDNHYYLRAAVRKYSTQFNNKVEVTTVGNLGLDTDWTTALKDVQVVIHTAARVHIMDETSNDPLTEFRKINRDGTLRLAQQAVTEGVKRFIFISSIKVNGEITSSGKPFNAGDSAKPVDPYGISKHETELGLLEIASNSDIEITSIRPPIVYGSGVKANFYNMMKWLYKGVPLPFGAIYNNRSLVALDNLVDLIITCIDHPAAANQVFLVSDGEDLSTTELLRRVAFALGIKVRLLPINQQLLEFILKLVGKKKLAHRLCGSLQVDISKTKKLLNWTPPVSVNEGLRKTTEHFLESQSK